MARKKDPTANTTTSDRTAPIGIPRRPLGEALFALEPRYLFDAAGVATATEIAADLLAESQAQEALIQEFTSEQPQLSGISGTSDLVDALIGHSSPDVQNEIIFIDSRVEDYETLIAGLDSNIEVVMLDASRDGVEQIAEALDGRTEVAAIHIVAHGDAGRLQLGDTTLTQESMDAEHADELAAIAEALSGEADILIYGCNFAEGLIGANAVKTLAALTGADIAASDDLTGSAQLGGDWDLEVSEGLIETDRAFAEAVVAGYEYILAPKTITTNDDTASTNEDTAVAIDLSVNDSESGGDADLTKINGTAVGDGDTVILTNGSVFVNSATDFLVTYTPNADFNGMEVFTYTGKNGGATDTSTVTVTVNAVADIVADMDTTGEETTVVINVLGTDNFEDVGADGDLIAAAVTGVTNGANGTVVNNMDGTVDYTPNLNFVGNDTFTYTVTAGGVTEMTTVSVNVTNVNDMPSITSANSANVVENITAVLTVTATDVDTSNPVPDVLSFSILNTAGTDFALFSIDAMSGVLTFTSAPDFETPIDVGGVAGDGVYVVDVRVDDQQGQGNSTDSQTIQVTVTDFSSQTSISANDSNAAEAGGDPGQFTVDVGAVNTTGGAVTVSYSITGTATPTTDYSALSGSVVVANTQQTATIDVSGIVDDMFLEGDETVIVTITGTDNADFTIDAGNDTAQVTITDDESAAVTIADVASDESGNLLFTATLDNAVSGGFAVDVSFTDVSATGAAALGAGIDYVNSAQTLNFAGSAGETVMFTVLVNEDAVLEVDEGFTLALGNVLPATAPFTSIDVSDTASGTITDNDTAAVTIADVASDESGNLLFTATLDNAVSGGFAVDVSFTDVSATGAAALGAGIDYVNSAQTLNFAGSAGETVMFTVLVNEDAVLEVDEGFTLALGNVLPATAPFTSIDVSDTASGTITDNDTAAVTIADVASDESGNLLFTATLDNAVSGGFAVDVSFTDVSATGAAALGAGIDYVNSAQTLNFAGSAGETVMFTVLVNEDAVLEVDEGFTLALGNVLPATAPFTSIDVSDTASGTITDNDTAAVTIADVASDESGNLLFTATLDNAVSGGFAVDVSFTDVSATGAAALGAGIDYVNSAQTLNFAGSAGETVMFTVLVNEDAVLEVDEGFTLALGNVLPATAPFTSIDVSDTASGTITDNDTAAVTIADVASDESGNLLFTATLDNAVSGGFAVDVSFTDVSATGAAALGAGIDYVNSAQTLNFAGSAGETVMFTVLVNEDAVLEVDEGFTLALGNVLPATAPFTSIDVSDTASGTITDNDTAAVTIADVASDESGNLLFTATLDNAVSGGFAVDVSFTDVSATGAAALGAGIDYVNSAQTLNFAGSAGETVMFTVLVNEDAVLEVDEGFTLALGNVLPATAPFTSIDVSDTASGTITDNDTAAVTIADVASDESGNLLFTATLDNAVSGGFAVDVSFTDVSATGAAALGAGIDYVNSAQTLNFAGSAGETVMFTVLVNEDAVLEVDEGFTLALGNVLPATAPFTSIDVSDTASGTITDNDTAAVTIADVASDESGNLLFTATLDNAVSGGFAVDVSFTDVSATGAAALGAGIDYVNSAQTLNFAGSAGETVMFTVLVNEDAVLEVDEGFTLALGNVLPATAPFTSIDVSDTASGTINDNDTAAVTIADVASDESGNLLFTATLDNAVSGGFAVDVSLRTCRRRALRLGWVRD